MNLKDEKYNKYALVREMMETPGISNLLIPQHHEVFAEL